MGGPIRRPCCVSVSLYQTGEHTAAAVFKIKSAEEIPFGEGTTGPKLTKGTFELEYSGDLEGEGILEEIQVHFTPKRVSIDGYQRVTGKLKNAGAGSFVLKHEGRFSNGIVYVTMTVVPGSGTEGLKGLRGEIILKSGPASEFPITFNYRFA